MRLLIITLVFTMIAVGSVGQEAGFRSGVVIFKVKDSQRIYCLNDTISQPEIASELIRFKTDKIIRKFAYLYAGGNRSVPQTNIETDVSLVYEIHYTATVPEFKVIKALMQTGLLEYAEPAYIHHTLIVPNDAELAAQWHLEAINAFNGWDIDTGSKDIVIAIIDTGIDWKHEDLEDAIQYNLNDPIDSVDNDSNGYVDDYRGWNFFGDNSDPDENGFSHGTHVAGLAGASTNNEIGIAGVGYLCKVLPIKGGDKISMTHGYEGIGYALLMGAEIINCSWGSQTFTFLGRDMVNLATERGALVVCGAGNTNSDTEFYPASFSRTLSVAGTAPDTSKYEASTYNYNVDMSAPGTSVVSTKNNNVYETESGTSMSSPIVAGAAALVKHRFPGLSPAQIKAQLTETTVNIDSLHSNAQYAHRLGSGQLDLRAALDSLVDISIGIENYDLTDYGDDAFELGEKVYLGVELINYLGKTEAIEVSLEVLDTVVSMIDSVKVFPKLTQNGRSNNYNDPFSFRIDEVRDFNELVDLRLTIKSGDYKKVEHLRMNINPDYVHVNVNDIKSTVTSIGTVGFVNFGRTIGHGFELVNEGNFLFECGLMIGTEIDGKAVVVDRVRGTQNTDRDFWPVKHIESLDQTGSAAFLAKGSFNDVDQSISLDEEIGLDISQKVLAYREEGHRNYMILEYTIKNNSGRDLDEVYVGMFADWDILIAEENRGRTTYSKRMGYIYFGGDPDYCAGIQQLNPDIPFWSYMIDNRNEGSGGVNQGEGGFTGDEKLITLSTLNLRQGIEQEKGSDISQVVSAGGYSIAKGDSISVAFAMMAARSVDELLDIADSSYSRYVGHAPGAHIYAPLQSLNVSPNPTTGTLKLDFDLKERAELEIEVFDVQGNLLQSIQTPNFYPGANIYSWELPALRAGVYIVKISSENIYETFQFNYIRP